jgi:hypothetical protein
MKYKVILYWSKEYTMSTHINETKLDSIVEKTIVQTHVIPEEGELSWTIQPLANA